MEKILLKDIPNKDKIISASQRLSGLELHKLSVPIKRKFKQELSHLNSIITQYPIKTFDDYELISIAHLQEMVDTLMRICQRLKKFSCSNYALIRGL
ncbi:MAG: hypothetical protein KDD20_12795 [Mangrovimonas sp.]|nr:hypothetical protein [Mangrovimonas sp.]MCB0605447.1 hypothetical protein [Saprospiraceae bacterium]